MPRTYRGKDILWWMDAAGLLDERYDQIPDLVRARNLPSMQLVGITRSGPPLDLNALSHARGAAGRHGWPASGTGSRSSPVRCRTCARWPTSSWARLLDTIDAWAARAGFGRRSARRSGSRRPRFPRPRR